MATKTPDELLADTFARVRQKCFHKTTYSHEILVPWLQSVIKTECEICIPTYKPKPDSTNNVLSAWPKVDILDVVLEWLRNQNVKNPTDLVDGACEPLALYLSSHIKASIVNGDYEDFDQSMRNASAELVDMESEKSAEIIFQKFTIAENVSPLLWGNEIRGSFSDYLFGSNAAKEYISSAYQSPCIGMMPLYILNYIFDKDELTDEQLSNDKPETAQYSCHVVGLVFDKLKKRIIVVDPNGPLIPGSNMEFLVVPFVLRNETPSTSNSQYDIDQYDIDQYKKRRKRKAKFNASKRVSKLK